ncbi:MAG TPA: GGDEF domain-containing protein [Mycobacteriales bacterium]|nr:GGDEF domain-containing protein [Mycobacteriales bacterium]
MAAVAHSAPRTGEVRARTAAFLGTPHIRLWLQFFGAGLIVSQISLALLRPGLDDRLIIAAANILGLLLVAIGTAMLPAGSRLARLLPPVVVLTGLGVVGATTENLAPALGGFFVITFVYVGLTQPAWTSLWLVAPATGSWLLLNRPLDHTVLAKMPVALSLWTLLAELLSRVSAQRQADQERLAEQAAHDALTGLRNRRGLEELLEAADVGDAVVFLDLDHFKAVNDLFGHETGDRVIADLGRIVLAVLRPGDIAVRYGGEEVLLLLPATDAEGVEALMRRLRRGWSASHPELTFSAGVAIVDEAGGADAARDADDALYRAKQRGRNRFEFAEPNPSLFIPEQKRPAAAHPSRPGVS